MVTRKAKLGNEIDQEILSTLKSSKNPVSTRDLSLKIKRAWYSVQTHCLKLKIDGKIDGFTITNINVWLLKK